MISDNSYLWAWTLERNGTLHIHVQHGKSLQRVQYRSHRQWRSRWMRRMLGQKVRSTRHNAVRHVHGQLVTRFLRVDRATSWMHGSRFFVRWRRLSFLDVRALTTTANIVIRHRYRRRSFIVRRIFTVFSLSTTAISVMSRRYGVSEGNSLSD